MCVPMVWKSKNNKRHLRRKKIMNCKKLIWLGMLGAFCFVVIGCSSGGGKKTSDVEICDDGVDNTGNGLTDCYDPDCYSFPGCQAQCPSDCSRPWCSNHPDCQSNGDQEICDDGIDNTGNGLTDCYDPDCYNFPACQAQCPDDCDLPWCGSHSACQGNGDANLSCMGLQYCYYCCPQDQACYDACDAAATADANQKMDAFYGCVFANCETECTGSDNAACDACVDANCQSQIDACDWNSTGTAGCITLNNCLSGCSGTLQQGGGNASTCPSHPLITCYNECYGNASQQGADLLDAFIDCVWDQCETECTSGTEQECQECYQAACAAEMNACGAST